MCATGTTNSDFKCSNYRIPEEAKQEEAAGADGAQLLARSRDIFRVKSVTHDLVSVSCMKFELGVVRIILKTGKFLILYLRIRGLLENRC